MNRRLNRVLDEIQKTEERIAEWQSRLKDLNIQRKQMEDAEILKCIRSTKLEGRELMEFLARVQEGSAELLPDLMEPDGKEPETENNNTEAPEDVVPESEDSGNEKEG